MASPVYLSYDLIARVMEICQHNYDLLFQCSLVNWEFNRAATRMLYRRVVLAPAFRPVLDLRYKNSIPVSAQNAPYVLALEISGYLSPRPPPRNTLSVQLLEAIKAFVNIGSVTMTPLTFHEDLFLDCLSAMRDWRCLTEVVVNESCMTDGKAAALVGISGLRKVTLISPGRAILNLLPDWLGRLSSTLVELHLKDNCGSITPGVLRSFIPHIQDNLRALTLGLSYSLTDEDVLTCLADLPELKSVQLRYYWACAFNLISPRAHPKLNELRAFTVTHPHFHSRREVGDFCKWIRRAISGSPIGELRVICDDDPDIYIPGPHLRFDGLIDHLVMKHCGTLRSLDLGSAFVGVGGLKSLLAACTRLEVLKLRVGRNALNVFSANCAGLVRLRSASFHMCNVKPHFRADDALIDDILRRGLPSLRTLTVNDVSWEACWCVNGVGETVFTVKPMEEVKPPWDPKD
ncbi:hypothetical protein B0H34DRAFT_802453 [Crassisporium funariophilum]|nr:hypothetical protein B0H34DRAFT_802453 [Crassisporium funariophilum]